MCYQGYGVTKDYVEAYKWILLADMNSYDASKTKNALTKLTFVMDPIQIAEAKKRAKEFVAKQEKEKDAKEKFEIIK